MHDHEIGLFCWLGGGSVELSGGNCKEEVRIGERYGSKCDGGGPMNLILSNDHITCA